MRFSIRSFFSSSTFTRTDHFGLRTVIRWFSSNPHSRASSKIPWSSLAAPFGRPSCSDHTGARRVQPQPLPPPHPRWKARPCVGRQREGLKTVDSLPISLNAVVPMHPILRTQSCESRQQSTALVSIDTLAARAALGLDTSAYRHAQCRYLSTSDTRDKRRNSFSVPRFLSAPFLACAWFR